MKKKKQSYLSRYEYALLKRKEEEAKAKGIGVTTYIDKSGKERLLGK